MPLLQTSLNEEQVTLVSSCQWLVPVQKDPRSPPIEHVLASGRKAYMLGNWEQVSTTVLVVDVCTPIVQRVIDSDAKLISTCSETVHCLTPIPPESVQCCAVGGKSIPALL